MECPRCHAPMKEGETYCVRCGFNQLSAQNSTTFPNSSADTNNQQIDFLDCFIGNHADEMRMQNFSWCTFFFGIFYYFYRKMYVQGFIVFSIYSAVSRFIFRILPFSILCFIIDLFLWLLISSMTKQLYISHAKKQINQMRREYPNLNDKEFAALLRSKGGTSIVAIAIIGFIMLMIVGGLTFLATMLTKNTIELARDKDAINTGYGVFDNLRLSIVEKTAETEDVIPINTPLPIIDYLHYHDSAVKGGTFIIDENMEIKLLDLELDGNYICSGTNEKITCKKK